MNKMEIFQETTIVSKRIHTVEELSVLLQIKLRMFITRLNQVNRFNVIGYAKILITNLMQSKKL